MAVEAVEGWNDVTVTGSDDVVAEQRGTTNVVYLAGMGRSGSTLLDRLLGQVEGWWSLGELVHLWERGLRNDERCGCGAHFSACPVWRGIGEHAFGGWDRVDVDAMHQLQSSVERDRYAIQLLRPTIHPGFQRRLRAWNDVVRRLYAAARAVTGARVVVDASKHVSTLLARRHAAGVSVLPVHLVRDSRGVAHSWTRAVDRPATDGRQQMTRWSPLESSLRYTAYTSVLGAVLGDDDVQLRYEDLVADPAAAVRTVIDARDDDGTPPTFEETAAGWAVDLDVSHGLAGNPMRSSAGTTVIRRDDSWRDRLAPRHRRLVTTLTLPTLLRMGYPVRDLGQER